MVNDLTVQLRKHGPVFVGVGAVLMVSTVVTTAWDNESALIICSLANLVLWCAITAYTGYQLFRALHVADDYLLLSQPRGPRASVVLLGATFWIYLLALGAIEVASWALTAGADATPTAGDLLYAWIARALSFAAFLAVVAVASLATKVWRTRALALIVALTVLTLVIVALGALDLHLVRLAHPGYQWTLGIDTGFHGFSQYATVLPLAIRPPHIDASPANTLFPLTLAVNAGVVALAAAIWIPLQRIRINLP